MEARGGGGVLLSSLPSTRLFLLTLPLMCSGRPRSCQVQWWVGGWVWMGFGGREKANLMGFGSAVTKRHSCTDGNDEGVLLSLTTYTHAGANTHTQ